jgi:hypothetical protein
VAFVLFVLDNINRQFMKNRFTTSKRRLSLGQTLIICGLVFAFYQIFRSPELDLELKKFESKMN